MQLYLVNYSHKLGFGRIFMQTGDDIDVEKIEAWDQFISERNNIDAVVTSFQPLEGCLPQTEQE